MSVDKLRRVLQRIRHKHGNEKRITIRELERAIMFECGTDPSTYRNNKRALKKLGWIKTDGRAHVILTDDDVFEGY